MLYLIEDRDYVKIGYSRNVDERIKQYRTCNCYVQLIGTKPGTLKDEKALHKICEPYQYSTEWFHNVTEVKEAFWNYQSGTIELTWLKDMLIKRYKKFESTGSFPELSSSESDEIRKIRLVAQDIPELNTHLNYLWDQITLNEVLKFIKYGIGQVNFDKIKMVYSLLPNVDYNINKNVAEILFNVNESIQKYKKHKQEYFELKPIIEAHEETLEQNHRFYQLHWLLEEFDIELLENKVKFYDKFITKFSSED